MRDGYPEQKDLNKILNFKGSIQDFVKLMQDTVNYGDSSFRCTGKRVLRIQFHTFGCSGNETIEAALKRTCFWFFCWEKSIRGGHHYFKVSKNAVGFDRWGAPGKVR